MLLTDFNCIHSMQSRPKFTTHKNIYKVCRVLKSLLISLKWLPTVRVSVRVLCAREGGKLHILLTIIANADAYGFLMWLSRLPFVNWVMSYEDKCTQTEIPANQKKYQCHFCDLSYKNKSHLTYHITVKHTPEKRRWKCAYCGLCYVTRDGLVSHYRSLNTRKAKCRFQCRFCEEGIL